MQYRVFFTTGQSALINEWEFSCIQSALTTTGDPIYMKQGDEPYKMFHIKNITHILPEEEVSSGITSSPTPDDLRDQKHKQEEAIKSDPKAILERATKKYDEGGE